MTNTATVPSIITKKHELDEPPLQQDEPQNSKNSITSNNLKIPHLGGFNSIIANSIEDQDYQGCYSAINSKSCF